MPKIVVIVPCSSMKSVEVPDSARASALPRGSQHAVSGAWLDRLGGLEPATLARDLYAGRAFRLARRAAERAGAELYVISAGLGLVRADTVVPGYGLSVSAPGSPDNIQDRIIDEKLDIPAWGLALRRGKYSAALPEAGLVVGALTGPYHYLLSPYLNEYPSPEKVRLIGQGAEGRVHPSFRGAVLPYEREKLDAQVPGTGFDFPARALVHFLEEVLPHSPSGSISEHRRLVGEAMSGDAPAAAPRGGGGLLF